MRSRSVVCLALAGATGVNGAVDEGAAGSGAAYVFVRRGATWAQAAYVKASNTIRNSALGADGATLAVAANGEDSGSAIDGDQKDNSVRDSGAVYIF